MAGRPTDCTPEIIKILSDSVENGLSIEKACDLSEICCATYQSWKNRGQRGESPFVDFLVSIKKAMAKRTERRIKRLQELSEDQIVVDEQGHEKILRGNWLPIVWLEERQNRDEFGKNITKMKFDLPDPSLSEMEQVTALSAEIVRKMASGELSAEQATAACAVIEQRRKVLETADFAKRLEVLENKK